MLRVICIDAKGLKNPFIPPIKEGEVYEVIRDWKDPEGELADAYELQEIGDGWLYAKRFFIPLSDKDEIHMEYKKKFSLLNLFSWIK